MNEAQIWTAIISGIVAVPGALFTGLVQGAKILVKFIKDTASESSQSVLEANRLTFDTQQKHIESLEKRLEMEEARGRERDTIIEEVRIGTRGVKQVLETLNEHVASDVCRYK